MVGHQWAKSPYSSLSDRQANQLNSTQLKFTSNQLKSTQLNSIDFHSTLFLSKVHEEKARETEREREREREIERDIDWSPSITRTIRSLILILIISGRQAVSIIIPNEDSNSNNE